MKEVMHMRAFELRGAQYYLIGGDVTFEQYVVAELNLGYMVTDVASFGIERFRLITSYSPASVERYLASGSGALNMSDTNVESV